MSVTAKVLLWLWDLEKKRSERPTPSLEPESADQRDEDNATTLSTKTVSPTTLFLVSGNDFFAPLLKSLKHRG
jgi:hypothetical protein